MLKVSYNAAGVLSHLASDGPLAWTISQPSREHVLERLVRAVTRSPLIVTSHCYQVNSHHFIWRKLINQVGCESQEGHQLSEPFPHHLSFVLSPHSRYPEPTQHARRGDLILSFLQSASCGPPGHWPTLLSGMRPNTAPWWPRKVGLRGSRAS